MRHIDIPAVVEVGDGSAEFNHAVVGAGTELHPSHGDFEQVARGVRQDAKLLNFPRAHIGIGDQVRVGGETLGLVFACAFDLLTEFRRRRGALTVHQLVIFDTRHVNVNVDSVKQRPGELRLVTLNHRGGAGTLPRRVAVIPARARVMCRDQHEIGRECQRAFGAPNGDNLVLNRLAQHLQHFDRKLVDFVKQ